MKQHNAPSVVYPVSPSYLLLSGLSFVWLMGLAAVLLWWHTVGRFDWRIAIGIAMSLMAGSATWYHQKGKAAGQLVWDGHRWAWQGVGNAAELRKSEQPLAVILDLQHRMVVRFDSLAGPSQWSYVERSSMPERWMDLRRAVYSPRKTRATSPIAGRRAIAAPLWRRLFVASPAPLHPTDGRQLPHER